MNYDLVKKLKDAGFPQKGKGDEIQKGYTVPLSSGILDAKFIVEEESYNPTLEELIEACELEINLSGYKDKWDCNFGFLGKTPSEAVANLWLEINKK